VVSAHADVIARVPLSAPLAHDNVSGKRAFAAEQFDTEALASRVAPVAR